MKKAPTTKKRRTRQTKQKQARTRSPRKCSTPARRPAPVRRGGQCKRRISFLRRTVRVAWAVLRHAATGIITVVLQLLYLIWKRRLGL